MSSTPMRCRGVRGAITVDANTPDAILDAAHDLLITLIAANDIVIDDIGSVTFTTTPDLDAEYPAVAARRMGWTDIAMLCTHEMAVPGSLTMVLRVLIMWNTTRAATDIQHVYMRDAAQLRPDRSYTIA